jgi:hypothetical protein
MQSKQIKFMEGLTKSELKAVEMCVKFMVDDITEELDSYENAGMEDAAQTSREVLGKLYNVLGKVRKIGMEYDASN